MSRYYLDNRALEEAMSRFRESKRQQVRYGYLMEDLKQAIQTKVKRRRSADQEQKALAVLVSVHAEACAAHEAVRQQLAADFYVLASNIVRYAKFAIDPDDAIQDCVMTCLDKIEKFDPDKGKAFNYLTTCCMNGLRQGYRTVRNYHELQKKYYTFQTTCGGHKVVRNGRELNHFDGITS